MKKRIYRDFIVLILICVLCLSVPVICIFYGAAKNKEIEAIRENAYLTADFINTNKGEYRDFISGNAPGTRMTIIAPDGKVILDSLTDSGNLENHSNRDEFIKALSGGAGDSLRYSSTSKSDVFYFAIRLEDGNVLRVSRPVKSVISAFSAVLPAIIGVTLLVLFLAQFAARRLTDIIVKPLGSIDFNAENAVVYDELTPYIKKIERQKSEIDEQFGELKNRAETIDLIAGNMKEGLLLTDKNGAILRANKSAAQIFGGGAVIGENILHLCREADFIHAVKRCLAGENNETRLSRSGRFYSVFFSPSQYGAIILFFDSTQKELAEKQRREFSANVSHELKTPLTAIMGLSELIAGGMAKKEDIAVFADKITEQTRRLIDIIDDIIKLSEFDEGVRGRGDDPFGLFGLAEEVAAVLSRKAEEKNVTVKVTGLETEVKADRLMIDEMLYNLIDNAINYNNPGGSVTVNIDAEGDYSVITVSDTGIGIPEKHLGRVFERFYRVDKSRSKKTGGTGLGLSIVKHIAEEHGGRVEIKSEVGKGTEVKCFIQNRF